MVFKESCGWHPGRDASGIRRVKTGDGWTIWENRWTVQEDGTQDINDIHISKCRIHHSCCTYNFVSIFGLTEPFPSKVQEEHKYK